MKSTGLIFQDFSIAGILNQWMFQQQPIITKDLGAGAVELITTMKEMHEMSIGCKTETRRTRGLDKINEFAYRWDFEQVTDEHYVFTNSKTSEKVLIKCPWGKVGDEIWVKEPYSSIFLEATGRYSYKADPEITHPICIKWKSPMFMPKAASRILLEITNLSIERLQDITEEGAMREGVFLENGMYRSHGSKPLIDMVRGSNPVYAYQLAWQFIHGRDSWDKNIFVWVIQFKVKSVKNG